MPIVWKRERERPLRYVRYEQLSWSDGLRQPIAIHAAELSLRHPQVNRTFVDVPPVKFSPLTNKRTNCFSAKVRRGEQEGLLAKRLLHLPDATSESAPFRKRQSAQPKASHRMVRRRQ